MGTRCSPFRMCSSHRTSVARRQRRCREWHDWSTDRSGSSWRVRRPTTSCFVVKRVSRDDITLHPHDATAYNLIFNP